MKRIILFAILCFCSLKNFSQCPVGEIQVSISIKTDDYGKEGYWELVPSGNNCGTGTIFSGGNSSVGCNGGGQQNNLPGGYPSDSLITEGPWCLTIGANYDIIFTDDYADGGMVFTVYINGYPVHSNLAGSGNAPGTRFTFTAEPPPASDLACHVFKTPSYVTMGNVLLSAWIVNRGTDTVHTASMFYKIDNNSPQTSVSGVNINPFDSAIVSSVIPWNIIAAGDYLVSIGATAPNGNLDVNASNDTARRTINAGPPIPNIIDDYLVSTPVYTVIGDAADSIIAPRDLDFHPILSRYELWVVLKGSEFSGGSTVKFKNAGQPNQISYWQKDGNAGHFMDLPTGIAFSENENFATSPGVYNANHGGGNPFTGPTLWSSDSLIYAHYPPQGNGSHLDMLHQSPYSMGICAEEDNIFWVYDDNGHEIVRYDFKKDHGPGNSDHSDGVIRRFSGMNLAADTSHEIPSHLILNKESGILYIVDTDNHRILKLDIHTGTFAGNLVPYEGLAEYSTWANSTWSVIVDSGLIKPCGIDLFRENRLVVSDYDNGDIIIYDITGNTVVEMGRIVTGTPGIAGIKIGPDGKIWYVNALTNQVMRIDQLPTGINDASVNNFIVYPNPASSRLNVLLNSTSQGGTITFYDMKGAVVMTHMTALGEKEISFDVSDFSAGVYTLSLKNSNGVSYKKFVKQ